MTLESNSEGFINIVINIELVYAIQAFKYSISQTMIYSTSFYDICRLRIMFFLCIPSITFNIVTVCDLSIENQSLTKPNITMTLFVMVIKVLKVSY